MSWSWCAVGWPAVAVAVGSSTPVPVGRLSTDVGGGGGGGRRQTRDDGIRQNFGAKQKPYSYERYLHSRPRDQLVNSRLYASSSLVKYSY